MYRPDMSGVDHVMEEMVRRIAEATGDAPESVRALLLEDPEAFQRRYGEYLSSEEVELLGLP